MANIKLNISTGNVDIYATDGCINSIIKLSNDNQAQALHAKEKAEQFLLLTTHLADSELCIINDVAGTNSSSVVVYRSW